MLLGREKRAQLRSYGSIKIIAVIDIDFCSVQFSSSGVTYGPVHSNKRGEQKYSNRGL
jgi:hypothetical protein